MAEVWLLVAAHFSGFCGMAWLALAMKVHWQQVQGQKPLLASTERTLRGIGGAAIGGSLLLCLAVDHPSMAALVWVMLLTASALSVAFTLAFRPRWLVPLVVWLPRRGS